MFSWIWHSIFLDPIYNLLIFFVKISGGSLMLGIMLLTLLIKILLAPVYENTLKVQIKQKKMQPEIKKIKEMYPDDKETQTRKIMELFKENKTSPFSGCMLFLIQIPVIFALYRVIYVGIEANADLIYSFNGMPENIYGVTFGIDMLAPSVIIAIIVAVLQYIQISRSPAQMEVAESEEKRPAKENGANESDAMEDMTKNLGKSMKYFLPAMVFVFGLTLPAGIMIYWLVNVLFTLVQEHLFIAKNKDNLELESVS